MSDGIAGPSHFTALRCMAHRPNCLEPRLRYLFFLRMLKDNKKNRP